MAMRASLVRRHDDPTEELHADHPFLFFVRHVESGVVLFMGRVADPSAR